MPVFAEEAANAAAAAANADAEAEEEAMPAAREEMTNMEGHCNKPAQAAAVNHQPSNHRQQQHHHQHQQQHQNNNHHHHHHHRKIKCKQQIINNNNTSNSNNGSGKMVKKHARNSSNNTAASVIGSVATLNNGMQQQQQQQQQQPPPATATATAKGMLQQVGAKIKLREINPHLTCHLCKGYLIDVTTISECLHSFCRSCIIKFLQENSHCPVCEVVINKAKPNLKLDKTLQDIVYKLVPELFLNEMKRRREFYRHRPKEAATVSPEQRGEDTERTIFNAQETISLCLEYISDDSSPGAILFLSNSNNNNNNIENTAPNVNAAPNGSAIETAATAAGQTASVKDIKRFLLCPGMCRVDVLKKFVAKKYNVDTNRFHIDILYKRVPLPDHYTLIDIAYIYSWKRNEPMKFFFRITDLKIVKDRFDYLEPTLPLHLPSSATTISKQPLLQTATSNPPTSSPIQPTGKNTSDNANNSSKEKPVKSLQRPPTPIPPVNTSVKKPKSVCFNLSANSISKTMPPPPPPNPRSLLKVSHLKNSFLSNNSSAAVAAAGNKKLSAASVVPTVQRFNKSAADGGGKALKEVKTKENETNNEKEKFLKCIELTPSSCSGEVQGKRKLETTDFVNSNSKKLKVDLQISPADGSEVKTEEITKKTKETGSLSANLLNKLNKKEVSKQQLKQEVEEEETKSAISSPEKKKLEEPNLKSLLNTCKIPSSLSITCVNEAADRETTSAVSKPVINHIEILKLPDKETPQAANNVAATKETANKEEEQPKPGIHPNLPKIPTAPVKNNGLRTQNSLLDKPSPLNQTEKSVSTKRNNLLEIASQLICKKTKNEGKTVPSLHVNSQGKVAIPRLPPPSHHHHQQQQQQQKVDTLKNLQSKTLGVSYSVSVSQQKPEASKTPSLSPNAKKVDSKKKSPKTKDEKSPVKTADGEEDCKKPVEKPNLAEAKKPMPQALDLKKLQEKYNIQNLAQLSASINFPSFLRPAAAAAPMNLAAMQQAIILKQLEMQQQQQQQQQQQRQNWFGSNVVAAAAAASGIANGAASAAASTTTNALAQYEKFLRDTLNASNSPSGNNNNNANKNGKAPVGNVKDN